MNNQQQQMTLHEKVRLKHVDAIYSLTNPSNRDRPCAFFTFRGNKTKLSNFKNRTKLR